MIPHSRCNGGTTYLVSSSQGASIPQGSASVSAASSPDVTTVILPSEEQKDDLFDVGLRARL